MLAYFCEVFCHRAELELQRTLELTEIQQKKTPPADDVRSAQPLAPVKQIQSRPDPPAEPFPVARQSQTSLPMFLCGYGLV